MSAEETATNVIQWAILACSAGSRGNNAPPNGDLADLDELAKPSEALRVALGQLATVSAAHLRWPIPPLGDTSPLGIEGLVLAAAIGAHDSRELASFAISAVQPPRAPIDWVLRHGLVGHTLAYLPGELADDCRLQSPLTMVFERPVAGYEDEMMAFVHRLLEYPTARNTLQIVLAEPVASIGVREWRRDILDRLWLDGDDHRDFVLDVYESLVTHYRERTVEQARSARSTLLAGRTDKHTETLGDALSVARSWEPLWKIRRENVDALRTRRYLDDDVYWEGFRAYQLAREYQCDCAE